MSIQPSPRLPQDRVNKINQAWLRQNPTMDITSESINLFKEFNEKVWKGTKKKDRGSVLKMEYKVTKRRIEEHKKELDGCLLLSHKKYVTRLIRKHLDLEKVIIDITKDIETWSRLGVYTSMIKQARIEFEGDLLTD